MNKIRISNPKNASDYFDIPWDWIIDKSPGMILSDLESSAERSKYKAKLTRVRSARVPSGELQINKMLTQKEIYPLLKLIDLVKVNITYFEKYKNGYVTVACYITKVNPTIHEIPADNNTDNIVYNPFTLSIAAYEGIEL